LASGDDPRAPHILERREYWVLKQSTGKITELIKDHIKVFFSGGIDNMQSFGDIMTSISAQWTT
jgi:hypothetical protein